MAKLLKAMTDSEVKRASLNDLKANYIKLADFYNRIVDGKLVYCPKCGTWKSRESSFYTSEKSPDGIEHYACKECILDMCTDIDPKTHERIDNKRKFVETLRALDWYFEEPVFDDQLRYIREGVKDKNRGTAAQQWIVMLRSLHQYSGKTFNMSIFKERSEVTTMDANRKPRKEIIKLFGSGLATEDYLYLQDQYDDWCNRTQVDSKSQQTYIIRICHKLLDIYKCERAGKDTDKLDKSLNELMASANLQPRQNVGNSSTDSLTFGQLIEKWELEEPIPEPAPEFQDVDGIGKYIRVWFKGALSRALGIDNGYNKEYDDYIEEFTVKPPHRIDDEDEEENDPIYAKIFGKSSDG